MDESKIRLDYEVQHDEDEILIYTRWGIHDPTKPMGHTCMLAHLPCSDTEDEDATAFKLADLFIASPEMLGTLQEIQRSSTEDSVVQMATDAIEMVLGNSDDHQIG